MRKERARAAVSVAIRGSKRPRIGRGRKIFVCFIGIHVRTGCPPTVTKKWEVTKIEVTRTRHQSHRRSDVHRNRTGHIVCIFYYR